MTKREINLDPYLWALILVAVFLLAPLAGGALAFFTPPYPRPEAPIDFQGIP
jgi:hypothetical protein